MNEKTLNIIKRALYDVEMLEVKKMESLPHVEHRPSEEYTRKITALMEEQRKKEKKVFTPAKKLLAIIAAVIVIISVTVLSVSAIRKPVFEFFTEFYDKFIVLWSKDDEAPRSVEQEYCAQWIPEEYEMTQCRNYGKSIHTYYSDGTYEIVLLQGTLNSSNIVLDTEGATLVEDNIGDISIQYVYKNSTYSLLWMTEDYVFSLTCHDSIAWSDIERIVSNIVPKQ